PRALYLPGFGVINGKLYIAGGADRYSPDFDALYAYNITANSWTQLANLPQAVSAPGSAALNGKLWVFGGGYPNPTNATQIYDPATNTWTSEPSLNQERSDFYGAATVSNVAAIAASNGRPTGSSP